MRDWIELVAILAILVVDTLLLVDSKKMLHLYEDYFDERRKARKAAVTRWRGKNELSKSTANVASVQSPVDMAVESWDNEGGATGHLA